MRLMEIERVRDGREVVVEVVVKDRAGSVLVRRSTENATEAQIYVEGLMDGLKLLRPELLARATSAELDAMFPADP